MKHLNWGKKKRKGKKLVKERMSLIFPRPKLVPSHTRFGSKCVFQASRVPLRALQRRHLSARENGACNYKRYQMSQEAEI